MSKGIIKKYFAVFTITWQQGFVYRLNFILWRVRGVLQLLLIYFIWWTIFQAQNKVFGYNESTILTYIMVVTLIRAIVLSSRVMDVVNQISEGGVMNFLLKPLNFISYYFARDIADKLLNISFVLVEVTLIFVLLRPNIYIQQNIFIICLFIVSVILGLLLYFALNFTFGLLAFWLENMWGVFFLFFVIIDGLGGGVFPIDILPEPLKSIMLLTPFPYLLYFPAKLYLGNLSEAEILNGFFILFFWLIFFWLVMIKTLKAGLRFYTAVGG